MKIEFNNCAKAIRWITLSAKSEVDFQNLREQLDTHYFYTGMYFVFAEVNPGKKI